MPLSKQGVSSDKEATALKCATVYPFTHHRSLILFEPIKRCRHSQHTVYERFERNPEMQVVEEQEGFLRMSGVFLMNPTEMHQLMVGMGGPVGMPSTGIHASEVVDAGLNPTKPVLRKLVNDTEEV